MTFAVDNAKQSQEYRDGWFAAADGADYISNPFHGIRQEAQYDDWANGYIDFLDMLNGPEEH